RPVGGGGLELLLPGAGEFVKPRAARVLRVAPLGVQPSSAFETLERRQQGTRIHLEDAARDLLDAAGNAEAVHRLEAQSFQDEHVERALDDIGVGLVHGCDSSAPHLDCQDVSIRRAAGRYATEARKIVCRGPPFLRRPRTRSTATWKPP